MKWISKTLFLCFFAQSIFAGNANWFLNIQAGAQSPTSPHGTTVYNGSTYDAPFNQDRYTATHTGLHTLLGVQAGRRWLLTHPALQAFSLGAQYQYFANATLQGNVIQYSLPEFTNYIYDWHVASNVFLAQAKLNFNPVWSLSPYVNFGAGLNYQTTQYFETPLPDVTPRISPNFARHQGPQFTYVLGAGFDYPFNPVSILSLGYQFGMLGHLSSGPGNGSWSSQSLNLGTHQTNAVLFGFTYLVE